MVGVPLLGAGPGAEPAGAVALAQLHHVPHAAGEIGAFFDHRAPGGPDGGPLAVCRRPRQEPGKGPHILPVQLLVALPIHVVGPGGPLGIDVEHDPAVKAVSRRDAGDGFQGVVQVLRRGGGGVHPDADQGLLPPGAQDVTVFGVKIRHIEPLVGVIVSGLAGAAQGLFKIQQRHILALRRRNMHGFPPEKEKSE